MTWQARIDTALRAREASHSLRRRVVCTPAAGGALVHQACATVIFPATTIWA